MPTWPRTAAGSGGTVVGREDHGRKIAPAVGHGLHDIRRVPAYTQRRVRIRRYLRIRTPDHVNAGTDRTVMLARPLKTERTLTHPVTGTRTVRRSRRDVTLCHCHWHAYHTHRSRFFTVHAFAFRGLALCPRAAPLRNDAPAARPWHRHGLGAWSRGMVSSGAERLR